MAINKANYIPIFLKTSPNTLKSSKINKNLLFHHAKFLTFSLYKF